MEGDGKDSQQWLPFQSVVTLVTLSHREPSQPPLLLALLKID